VTGIFLLGGAPAAGVPGGTIEDAGFLSLGQVTLENSTTSGASGGGIDITSTGSALISRSVIGVNSASGGGVGGAIDNSGNLTLSESRLALNSAGGGGGGLATQAAATSRVLQSTLDRNTASGNGGGILNLGTTLADHTLIQLNSATTNGGGIFNTGLVSVTISTIHNNTPNNCFPVGSIPGCIG
jgi:predicted outer membrane repeat protein